MSNIILAKEHEEILNAVIKNKEELNDAYYKENWSYLGLHYENYRLYSHYIVGVCEFENNVFIIEPKKNVDYIVIFEECIQDEEVAKKIRKKVIHVNFTKRVKLYENRTYLAPVLAYLFERYLHKIVRKGLKRDYIIKEENLRSKIKGRIDKKLNIKYNLSQGRIERIYCRLSEYKVDCLENRILKSALKKVAKFLPVEKYRYLITNFEEVKLIKVYKTDFAKIKRSTFYWEYDEALQLARMIFEYFGFGDEKDEKMFDVPIHYINMPELFERYVEVKLKKHYQVIDGNEKSYTWGMRPDFILPNECAIVDAKYKFMYDESDNSKYIDDYRQIALYGLDKKIRDELEFKGKHKSEPDLIFIYPKEGSENDEIDLSKKIWTKNFERIYKYPLYIPMKKS